MTLETTALNGLSTCYVSINALLMFLAYCTYIDRSFEFRYENPIEKIVVEICIIQIFTVGAVLIANTGLKNVCILLGISVVLGSIIGAIYVWHLKEKK